MTFQIQKILASSNRSKSDSFHRTFPDNLLNTGTAQHGCRPLISLQQSLPRQGCIEIPLTSNPLSHFIHSRTWHWAPIMGQALFRMLGVQWWTWPILRNLSSSRESRYWFFFLSHKINVQLHIVIISALKEKCTAVREHMWVWAKGQTFWKSEKASLKNWHLSSNMKAKKKLNSLTAGLSRGFKELKCSGNSHKEATAFPFSIPRVALILGSFSLEHVVGLMPHSPRGTVCAQPSHLCRAQPSRIHQALAACSTFLLLCG